MLGNHRKQNRFYFPVAASDCKLYWFSAQNTYTKGIYGSYVTVFLWLGIKKICIKLLNVRSMCPAVCACLSWSRNYTELFEKTIHTIVGLHCWRWSCPNPLPQAGSARARLWTPQRIKTLEQVDCFNIYPKYILIFGLAELIRNRKILCWLRKRNGTFMHTVVTNLFTYKSHWICHESWWKHEGHTNPRALMKGEPWATVWCSWCQLLLVHFAKSALLFRNGCIFVQLWIVAKIV